MPPTQTLQRIALIAIALVAGILLRVAGQFRVKSVTQDEAITFLAATGHQAQYYRAVSQATYPVGVWVPAREWKRFVEPEGSLAFRRVAADLAFYDIHPPLFFWLLHVWVSAFGASPPVARLMNVLIFLPTTVLVYLVARRLLQSARDAAFATVVWVLSPAVVSVSWVARQYELAVLFTMLFLWVLPMCVQSTGPAGRSVLYSCALGGAVFGSMLTHYWLPIAVVLPSIVIVNAHVAYRGIAALRGSLFRTVGPACVAAGLFLLVQPAFLRSFVTASHQNQVFSLAELAKRIPRVVYVFANFSVPDSMFRAIVEGGHPWTWTCPALVVLVIATAAAVVWAVRRLKDVPQLHTRILAWPASHVGRDVLLLSAPALVTIAAYVTFLIPYHAMEQYHLSFVWPSLAIGIAALFKGLGNTRLNVTTRHALCAMLLAASVASWLAAVERDRSSPFLSASLSVAPNLVVNNTARAVLLPMVISLPNEMPVFAAEPEILARSRSLWADQLRPDSVIAISDQFHQPGSVLEILDLTRAWIEPQGFAVRHVYSSRLWILYAVGEKASRAALHSFVDAGER